jgi:hypothetical protein
MPEIADRLDELIDRLYLLGANDSVVDTVRAGWAEGDTEYRERLRRMNDVALAAEIRLAMQDELLDEDEEPEEVGEVVTTVNPE